MRVCIVAEHASTRFGGEAILPVHYFRLLRSLGIESWLVVHARTQSELGQLFPEESGRMLYVPDLWIHKLNFRLSRYLPRRLAEATFGLLNQLITQYCQRALVRQLIREKGVEIVHQPIPVAPRFPSLMYGLGVPVIIGPLNGGMDYPAAFRGTERLFSRAGVAFARLFVDAANALLPGKQRADVVLVANERTRQALPSGIRGRVIELVENGIDFGVWKGRSAEPAAATSRFIFIGRLVDWKAVDIVIRALEKVPSAELELIGDGPMMEALGVPWRETLECRIACISPAGSRNRSAPLGCKPRLRWFSQASTNAAAQSCWKPWQWVSRLSPRNGAARQIILTPPAECS